MSEPQNIIPVAHFHNNPLSFQQFGGFRPIRAHGSATQGPSVRNFRQASHPRFFINNNDGNFDGNGFFDHSAVHGDFSDGPSRDLPNFNRPRGYNGPQFHFQRDHHPHRLHSHHQRPEPTRIQNDHRPHFHGDDTTSHHSSATHNILGSGNFGIIRGGIFADDDNPPQSFHPFNGHRGEGGDDFFHGFRDFQPFGGPLNNALSVNSQNIQNSGSKTNSVTAKVAISVSPESPATTTTPINRTTTSSNQSQNKIVPTPKRQNV